MGLVIQTTKAPRYSPKMMKQMQQMYGFAGEQLMQDPQSISPEGMMQGQGQGAPGQMQAPQYSKIRDIQRTGFPQAPTPQQLPDAKFSSMDFAPIEQQAREGFYQQTVPTLAERFTSMGKGARGSAAFTRALGGAGAGLESSLAALKAKMLPEWEMKKAQYGLQRGQLGLQQQLGFGKLGLERAGLGQREQQMQLQRDLGVGGLETQRAGLQQRQQDYGLKRAQFMAQQQQARRKELLGMLGFKPPTMYGKPQVQSWQF